MNHFRAPVRRFQHPDGRTWEVAVEGPRLQLRIGFADGEILERARNFSDSDAASRELQSLVDEQLRDGFTEVSLPAWRCFLDELVEYWRKDDPAFPAAALREQILAAPAPSPAELVEHVMALADRPLIHPDGSMEVDLEQRLDQRARYWLEMNRAVSLPALLLALRHHNYQAQLVVEASLCSLRPREALPALLSVLEHPAENLAFHLGGRPQHIPTDALIALGAPAPETAARLIRALATEDFRIAASAAIVLSQFSTDDQLFQPLFAQRERAHREDSFAWSLLRAAEVRRDPVLRPFLEWMQSSSRFRQAAYAKRIRDALDGLGRPR